MTTPTKQSKERVSRKETKDRFVKAGYASKNAKWYWDKDEKAWCLPLRSIVLGED